MWPTWALMCVVAVAAGSGRAPTVAVMKVEAKQGLSKDVAELLTSSLAAKVKAEKRFTRVVSATEIETLLQIEQQRQLTQCETSSCMAEIAGALGVKYLLTSSVGRLGQAWLFNASLLDTDSATMVGSISETLAGKDEAVLANATGAIVKKLLDDARLPVLTGAQLRPAPPAERAPPPAPPPPAKKAPAPVAKPEPPAPAPPADSVSPWDQYDLEDAYKKKKRRSRDDDDDDDDEE